MMRFRLWVASVRRFVLSWSDKSEATTALTSMWVPMWGSSSARFPVMMLTTPPGRSEVARASARVMAQSGLLSEVMTIQLFHPAIIGRLVPRSPARDDFSGAMAATTPTAS